MYILQNVPTTFSFWVNFLNGFGFSSCNVRIKKSHHNGAMRTYTLEQKKACTQMTADEILP